ncbi:PorV/PorQ family protein [bacterium]|nr:PorV/PorQ family protein [bacterium]
MKKWIQKGFLVFSLFQSSFVLGGFVLTKYGDAFMRIGVGARPLGMGGACVAICNDVTSIYWNPAGLASMTMLQIHGMHSERFSGIVNWDFIGIGVPFKNNLAMGFGFFRLGVDGIPITALRDPSRELGEMYVDAYGNWVENDVYVKEYVNDHEMSFVFSFAKKSSNRLFYGGSIKVIRKHAGDYGAWGLGFDFGIMMNPYRSLQIGCVLLDGSSTLIAWNGGRKELIAPHIRTGIAYPVQIYYFDVVPLLDVHIDFENQQSGAQIHFGQIDLNLHGGIEFGFQDRIALRAGSDRGYITFGVGLHVSVFKIDYGFSHHMDLGKTHRISITLLWDKDRLFRF